MLPFSLNFLVTLLFKFPVFFQIENKPMNKLSVQAYYKLESTQFAPFFKTII